LEIRLFTLIAAATILVGGIVLDNTFLVDNTTFNGDGVALATPESSKQKPVARKSSSTKSNTTKKSSSSETTVKNKRPECITKLSKAATFDDGTQGEGGVSANYLAYADACGVVGTLETEDLEWLIENGTPAGRLYGAMLMKQTGRVGDAESFKKLEKDDSAVTVLCGCKGFPSRVSDIAKEFMTKGQYLTFRLSQFCKLKAPIAQPPGEQ
jgi:hypothetical protein